VLLIALKVGKIIYRRGMMLKDKYNQLKAVLLKEKTLANFNEKYRQGPDLYFYKRVLEVNSNASTIDDFLDKDYNLELLYATLVAWDMNSRGAKMKYFDKFKESINSQRRDMKYLWRKKITGLINIEETLSVLGDIYSNLHLMRTKSRLVSNSKFLHFVFPELLMPMDRRNTLMYFYNNTDESPERYLNIIRGSFELVGEIGRDKEFFIDDEWNRTIPKTIDNAIILKQGISIK
jgi:hypothetical protein